MTTTIRVSKITKKRLAALRSNRGETYDKLVNKLLGLLPIGDNEGLYTDKFRAGLLSARLDFREGRFSDHEVVIRHLAHRRSVRRR